MRKLLTFVLCVMGIAAKAQPADPCQKIGFADIQMIAQQLPETRQMEAELASLGGQLQNQLNAKYSLYNQKLRDFESPTALPDESLQQRRRDELLRLEQDMGAKTDPVWRQGIRHFGPRAQEDGRLYQPT